MLHPHNIASWTRTRHHRRLISISGAFLLISLLFILNSSQATYDSLFDVSTVLSYGLAGRNREHPIDRLVRNADRKQKQILSRQTSTLHDAAQAYRERRGRHPPPRFDQWYAWASAHNVTIVEEFFDTLSHDLEPFWDVAPAVFEDFAKSWPQVLSIRNGSFLRYLDEPPVVAGSMEFWHQGLSRLPLDMLPDVDLAMNVYDEPQVIVPWSVKEGHRARALARKAQVKPFHHPPTMSDFSAQPLRPIFRPPVDQRTQFFTPAVKQYEPLWPLAREACDPHSPAQTQNAPTEYDHTRRLSFSEYTSTHLANGYVADWSAAKSACAVPEIRTVHGSFVNMLSVPLEQPNGYRPTITQLVPLLSGCRMHDINSDILIPAAVYWPLDTDIWQFNFGTELDKPWSELSDKVVWRGSASGGVNNATNWTRFHRHRLVEIMNGTLVEAHHRAAASPLPSHVPGGTPSLPHNVPMPQSSSDVKALHGMDPSATLGAWLRRIADGAFVHLRCAGLPLLAPGGHADCAYNRDFFTVKPSISHAELLGNKYLPDVDGNSFSGRWRALLLSRSLAIKATVYDEWHDDRLVPWKHFVPMDNTYRDLYGMLQYFLGYGEDKGHDAVAEKIATEGSEWARSTLRVEDMLAYVYRVILELARLRDERRDEMGWADDLF